MQKFMKKSLPVLVAGLLSTLNPQPSTLNLLSPGQPHAAGRAGADHEITEPN
jgi:hypothetical protein